MQKSFIKQNKLTKVSLPIFLLLSLQYQYTNQGRVHPGQTSTLEMTYDPPKKPAENKPTPTKFSTGTSSSKRSNNQNLNQQQNQSGQGNNNSQLPQSTNQSNSVNTTIPEEVIIPVPDSTGEATNEQNSTDTTILFPQTPILYTNQTFNQELLCHDCLLSGYGLCFDNSDSAFSNLDFANIVTEADLPPHVCCQSNDPESCPQIQDASWFCTFGYDLNSAMNICPFNPEVCGESREVLLNLTTSDQFIVPSDIPADTMCYYQVTADCGIGQFVSTDTANNYEYAISYFMNYTYADAEQYPNLAQYIYPNAPDFCNIIGANVGVISRENQTVDFNQTIIVDEETEGNEPVENQPIENVPVDNTEQEEQQVPEGEGTPIVGQQIGGEDSEQEPDEGEEQQQPDGEGQEQIPDENQGEQTEQEPEGQEQVPDQENPDQVQENTDQGNGEEDVSGQITDYLNYWRQILLQYQNQIAQQQAQEDQQQPDSGTIENPENTNQTEENQSQEEQPQEEQPQQEEQTEQQEQEQEQPQQQIEENTDTSGEQEQEQQQIPDESQEQNAETGETPTIMPASGGRRRLAQVDDEFLQIFNEKEFDEDDDNIFYKTFKDEAQDVLDYGKQIYQTIEEKFNEIYETVQNYTQQTFDI